MKKLYITLLSLFLVLVTTITLLLSTSFGFNASLWLAKKILPGELSYYSAKGLLVGPIQASHIVYKSKNVDIEINQLHLQWNLLSLLFGKLHIENLKASDIKITQKPRDDDEQQAWTLPLAIKIDQATINHFVFNKKYHFPKIAIKQLDVGNTALTGNVFVYLQHPYSVTAEFKLKGNINAYQFNLYIKNEKINWRFHGSGTQTSLSLLSDEADFLDGKLNANIHLNWGKMIKWNAIINMQKIGLKHIDKSLPQHASLDLNTQGEWKPKALPTFKIDAAINSGSTHIFIKGQHEKKWDLTWNLMVPALSHWWPTLEGKLNAIGTAKGPTMTPFVSGKISAERMVIGKYEIRHLHASGHFDFSYQQPSHVLIKANNVLTPQAYLNQLDIDAVGQAHSHNLTANIYTYNKFIGKTHVYLNWEGGFSNQALSLNVRKLNLYSQHFGKWELNQPITFFASHQKVTFTPACWHSRVGKACFNGKWLREAPWQLQSNFYHVDLTPFFEKIKPGLSMRGFADFALRVSGDGPSVTDGQLLLAFKKASLHYIGENTVTVIHFNQADWSASLQNHILQSHLTVSMNKNDRVFAQILLPNFDSAHFSAEKQKMTGSLNLSLSQLGIFNLLIPNIFDPKGNLVANINISGTLKKPFVKGDASLVNGSVSITEAKINLTNLNANISAEGPTLLYDISARSKDTPVTVKGETDFIKPGFPTRLHIFANNLLVMNTIEYQIYASPDLTFSVTGRYAELKGNLFIPKAILSPVSFSGTVSLPDDTTIVGSGEENNEPLIFDSHVNIKMGPDVQVKARGLRGKLRGALTITRKQHQEILASGQLNMVGGTFTTHGKTLTITPGSGISFTQSPLQNPTLNVKATKIIQLNPSAPTHAFSANNITVGVQIAGTLKHPIWSLFSVPSTLSQADILSYLLFGQASSANTPNNISLLLSAITNLNLNDNSPGGPVSQISQTLGLTEFGVEQSTSLDALGTPLGYDQSSFVVGRYISPKIYVRYSRTLLAPINIFQIRYLFNKNWAAQSEVSKLGQGGDILYTIQK